MGAWGPGSFENDGALDWVAEFQDEADEAMLDETLRGVVDADPGDYVDVDDAAAALAAAEVVAATNGHAAKSLPEELASLALKPNAARTKLAVDAVRRVQAGSELQELWEENGPNATWRAIVDELLVRLAAPPVATAKKPRRKKKQEPSVREVATYPSPDGAWVFSISEIDSPAGANTQTVVSHRGGGAGVWAAMGTNLGVTARWLGARELEVSVPTGVPELQRQTRIQYADDAVTVTYRSSS
ncbi:MAG: DUF4259 domain-containing protein [Myxococcota bacterium]|nr:DUF4259 domain-containing protein [Myxococcota bacterium]